MFSLIDTQMMRRAIELARRGIYTTHPNPHVGCVIALNDRILGEGFHFRAGEPHAEIHALVRAKKYPLKGATVYVTLEPCSHFGRTPPCADALIEAGVKRVVCAMEDPNPAVSGRGIERLRHGGIQVDVGLMQKEAEALNVSFIKKMKTGMPYVQLKLASSLDGRTALLNGKSQWITGEQARADVQILRAQAGAVLSTSQTVKDDDPSLNVRWSQLPGDIQAQYPQNDVRQPLRIILDTHGTISPLAKIFSLPGDILILTARNDLSFINQDSETNIEVITLPKSNEGLDLHAALQIIGQKGIHLIWVEAGATLAGSLIRADLVDELIVYQSMQILGADSRPLVNLKGLTDLNKAPRFDLKDITRLGKDVRFRMKKPH